MGCIILVLDRFGFGFCWVVFGQTFDWGAIVQPVMCWVEFGCVSELVGCLGSGWVG